MNIDKNLYVNKITTATPIKLVIINYEIIIDYLNCALFYLNNNDNKNFEFNAKKARQFLSELRASLNMNYEISHFLMKIYNFLDKEIAFLIINKNKKHIYSCTKILKNLLAAWVNIEDDNKDVVMENTEQIFAGLTYNKNGKLDEFINPDTKRGFMA